jgi:hypothetical protein
MRTGSALFVLAVACALAACGSRTGLLVPLLGEPEEGGPDAEPGPDATAPDEGVEDATVDVTEPPDGHEGRDAREEDALPPIDVTPPPMDALNDCPDAGSTFIYVISSGYELLSFYPPTAAFTSIGTIACPGGGTPFSMAVDTTGVAYVEFNSGNIFRVSTRTAACVSTPFQPHQDGFTTFGMGFSANAPSPGETLFVASDQTPSQLASIDTMSFILSPLGIFRPAIDEPELTGTGAGDLFAFFRFGSGSAIGQIDKATAQVVAQSDLPGVVQGSGWAFGFWGGDFYTFTAPSGHTVVNRFRPTDGSVVQVASTDQLIVGAGVSTCAPQR